MIKIFSVKKLKESFKSKKSVAIFAVILIAAMLLIFSGELTGKKSSTASVKSFDADAYAASLEARLETLLSSVEGAGKSSVMITLEGGAEYIYETDTAQSVSFQIKSEDETGESNSTESNLVLAENADGGEAPVIRTTVLPKITGVLVICEGGGRADVRESMTNALKALLGISANKICVLKKG